MIGHSAGGQFVDRYAIGTPVASEPLPFRLKFIVSNPSSYLYLDERRPKLGQLDQFAVPADANCEGYNDYLYGFEHRNPYLSVLSAESLRSQFLRRQVVYLLGEADTLSEDWTCPVRPCGKAQIASSGAKPSTVISTPFTLITTTRWSPCRASVTTTALCLALPRKRSFVSGIEAQAWAKIGNEMALR